jgi:hypothetical protein
VPRRQNTVTTSTSSLWCIPLFTLQGPKDLRTSVFYLVNRHLFNEYHKRLVNANHMLLRSKYHPKKAITPLVKSLLLCGLLDSWLEPPHDLCPSRAHSPSFPLILVHWISQSHLSPSAKNPPLRSTLTILFTKITPALYLPTTEDPRSSNSPPSATSSFIILQCPTGAFANRSEQSIECR